jgi:hypothetical protein
LKINNNHILAAGQSASFKAVSAGIFWFYPLGTFVIDGSGHFRIAAAFLATSIIHKNLALFSFGDF